MGTTIRAGDLFAGRYRLTVLLDESGGGRFWRARDEVLARSVALHLVDRDDPRATALLDAARRSARVHDRRLLRVLDGDVTDDFCYVVNEWGEGLSLDLRLADSGPLDPRRAAWITSEFADTLARAHAVGEVHGRVVPENLLVDRHGQVRVIGFAVDAALRGEDPGTVQSDVADCGALLYAALTGRWAGRARSGVPQAPRDHGELLRARQVQAGVPRTLDLVCEDLVAGGARSRVTHTAQGLSDLLGAFVGDAQDLVNTEPDRPHRDALRAPVQRGDSDEDATVETPRARPAEEPEERPAAPSGAHRSDDTEKFEFVPSVLPPVATEDSLGSVAPTPSADHDVDATAEVDPRVLLGEDPDDDPINDLSWLTPRPDAPPAPELPAPAARPLFAPDPPPGQPRRRVRGEETDAGTFAAVPPPPAPGSPGTVSASSDPYGVAALPAEPEPADDHAWPWDEDPDREQDSPGRLWFRLAVVVGVLALVLLIAVAVKQVLSSSGDGQEAAPSDPSTSASVQEPVPVRDLVVRDFDPLGTDGGTESTSLVPLATDGNPETAWRTAGYKANFTDPLRLKPGVGLLVDLGAEREVTQVSVRVLGGETSASVYLTETEPTTVEGLQPIGSKTGLEMLRFSPAPGTTGRWAVIWLTSLPYDGVEYYRGQVAEIKVLARP